MTTSSPHGGPPHEGAPSGSSRPPGFGPGFPDQSDQGGWGGPPGGYRILALAAAVVVILIGVGIVTTVLVLGDDASNDRRDQGGSSRQAKPVIDLYCLKVERFESDEALENADENTEEGQQQVLEAFEELESSAPDELKEDYALLIDAFEAFSEGEQPEAADQAKLQEALTNITEDAEKKCDVKLDS